MKSREAAGCSEVQRVDVIDPSAGRSSPHRHLEALHRRGIAFRDDFNRPVMLVPDVPLNAFTLRRGLDEKSESHALHAALDDVPTPDEHGKL